MEHKTVRKFQGGILGSEFAYNITGKTATGVTKNRGIKILGTASTSNMSSNNSGSIFALNSQDEYTKIGNFSKPQIRDTVRQNVATIIRNNNLSDVVIQNGDYILDNISNFPDNKHTLIVNGGNLTLKVDIPAATDGKPRAVIVLGGDMKL